MRLPSKLLLPAVLLFTLGLSRTSFGQTRPQIITCASNNMRRSWCDFPRRNVTLTRQLSGSACIQRQTWGWDSRGIWVDRGCRAEFWVGSDTTGRRGGSGQLVTCSSNNNRRAYCDMPRRSVNVNRQLSGTPCIQGQSWGWDDRGIWVDRGCRADFLVR